MKVLWIDTETTGLDSERHGIIQLAAMVEIDGEVVDEREWRVRPTGKSYDPKALEVNGITPAEIAEYPTTQEVKLDVESWFERYIERFDRSDKFTVGAYNAEFDMRFLSAWSRIEIGEGRFLKDSYWPGSWIRTGKYIDPLRVVPVLEYWGVIPELPNHKLTTMAEHFGASVEGAHDAMVDIRLTRAVLAAIRTKIAEGGLQ